MLDQKWDPVLNGSDWSTQPDIFPHEMPNCHSRDITRQVQSMLQAAFPTGTEDFVFPLESTDTDTPAYRCMRADKPHSPSPDPGRYASLPLTVSSLLLDSFALPAEEHAIQAALAEQGFAVSAPYQLAVLAIRIVGPYLPVAAFAADHVLQQYCTCCSILSGGRILTLLASETAFSRLDAALEELLQVLRRQFDPDCVIGVSRRFHRFSQCRSACREAVDAQRFSKRPGICRIGDLPAGGPAQSGPPGELEADLERLLYGGNRAALEQYLTASLGGNPSDMQLLQLLAAAQRILYSALAPEEARFLLQRCGLEHPFREKLDIGQLQNRIGDLCFIGYDLLEGRQHGSVGPLCRQAMRMIEQHYMDEDLSLLSVSEKLHVSQSYLSANMKKYAGDTFINLLTRKRMEVAAVLLTESDAAVGDIAQRCGYADRHYFSFCFKKFYGISPLKMRQSGSAAAPKEDMLSPESRCTPLPQ